MPEARFIERNECASDIRGILKILKAKSVKECVIKTSESSHGDKVWVIKSIIYDNHDAVLVRFDGVELKLSSILGKSSLIFESLVRQIKQDSSPHSMNHL